MTSWGWARVMDIHLYLDARSLRFLHHICCVNMSSGVRCQVSGVRCQDKDEVSGVRRDAVATKSYLDVEDLEVYRMLCQLHIDVCDLTHQWPLEEKYELGSQARRSSNNEVSALAVPDTRHPKPDTRNLIPKEMNKNRMTVKDFIIQSKIFNSYK
jgi:hypothetical protein